jgi:tetrachlorobenzoquinone reductase
MTSSAGSAPRLDLRVEALSRDAERVILIELRRPDGGDLPTFTAGAHIDLYLPNRLVRSYSLVNAEAERARYLIAVALDRDSRGGSRWLHEALRVGDRLLVGPPRNDFALVEDAPHSLLIAGGIGITPLWSMIQRLVALGRSWELVYGARTRAAAAFDAPLRALQAQGAAVTFAFDGESDGAMPDVSALVARATPDTELYCCGPRPMLDVFEATTQGRGRAHVEYFEPKHAPVPIGGFSVRLARTCRTVAVAPGQSILTALEIAGLSAPFSCRAGLCGSCETIVLDGEPDHRDTVLSERERAANRTIMICCSSSKTDPLVLDL